MFLIEIIEVYDCGHQKNSYIGNPTLTRVNFQIFTRNERKYCLIVLQNNYYSNKKLLHD